MLNNFFRFFLYIIFTISLILILLFFFNNDPWGFSANLITEVLGIVITILFVDAYIIRQEEKKWEGVKGRVEVLVESLIWNIVYFTGSHFGVNQKDLEKYATVKKYHPLKDSSRMTWEFERWKITEVVVPKLKETSDILTNLDFQRLEEIALKMMGESDRILDRFGTKISTNQYQMVMDIFEAGGNLKFMVKQYEYPSEISEIEYDFGYLDWIIPKLLESLIKLGDYYYPEKY